MKKVTVISILATLFLLVTVVLVAHPHFNKTVTCKLGEVEAKLTYLTVPGNESHIAGVKVGAYNKSLATLSLSGDVTVGSITLAAGDYNVGAIKNDDGGADWTLALHKGKLGFRDAADESKVIKLPSLFSRKHGTAEHVYFDISPGFGKFEGKAVLIWHFGSYYLAGGLG